MVVEPEHLSANLGQALRAQHRQVDETLDVLMDTVATWHVVDLADVAGVVLELVVRRRGLALTHDQHVVETPEGNASPRADLDHLGDISLLRVGLGDGVGRRLNLRIGLHKNPGLRPVHTTKPRIHRRDVTATLVVLGIAAEDPEVPLLVLGDVVERRLCHLAAVDFEVEDDHGPHPGDLAVHVGDGGRDLMGHAPLADIREPFADPLSARHEGQIRIRASRRVSEVGRIELRVDDFRRRRRRLAVPATPRRHHGTRGERNKQGGHEDLSYEEKH